MKVGRNSTTEKSAQLAETLRESLAGRTIGTGARPEGEICAPGDFPRWLRLGGERRDEHGEGESADEPDDTEPHGGVFPHTGPHRG